MKLSKENPHEGCYVHRLGVKWILGSCKVTVREQSRNCGKVLGTLVYGQDGNSIS